MIHFQILACPSVYHVCVKMALTNNSWKQLNQCFKKPSLFHIWKQKGFLFGFQVGLMPRHTNHAAHCNRAVCKLLSFRTIRIQRWVLSNGRACESMRVPEQPKCFCFSFQNIIDCFITKTSIHSFPKPVSSLLGSWGAGALPGCLWVKSGKVTGPQSHTHTHLWKT